MKKELGKVEKADLFIEDHGCLTFFIYLDFGGSSQGFGGLTLDEWSKKDDRRIGTAAGLDLILRLLSLFSVDRLSEIKGRSVFAVREKSEGFGPIIGLELPQFDGGASLLVEDWRSYWYPGKG